MAFETQMQKLEEHDKIYMLMFLKDSSTYS